MMNKKTWVQVPSDSLKEVCMSKNKGDVITLSAMKALIRKASGQSDSAIPSRLVAGIQQSLAASGHVYSEEYILELFKTK